MTPLAGLLIVAIAALFVLLLIELGWFTQEKAAREMQGPRSRKHIRISHHSDYAHIAYYGHNGRKVTARNVSYSDLLRIKARARSLGYRAI